MKTAQYFTADWCQPCRSFRPIAERVFSELNIPIVFIDVDTNIEAAFNIYSVPTILVRDGPMNVIDTIVGAFPEPALRERLTRLG